MIPWMHRNQRESTAPASMRGALALPVLALLAASPAVALAQGNAVSLDGALDHVDFGNLDPGASFTVEAWVRFDGIELSNAVISAAAAADALAALNVGYVGGAWTVALDDDDAFEGDDCETTQTLCLTAALSIGVPVHVAVVVAPGSLQLFLDGVLAASDSPANGPGFAADTWILGAETDGAGFGSDALEGVIDEVRVWSVARSAAQIACTRDWSLTGAEAGLYAAWPMDDFVFSSTVSDVVSGTFNGLLQFDAELVASPFAISDSAGGDIPCNDGDGDGESPDDGDCDDLNSSVFSTASEICDGIDQDCDGFVDESCVPGDDDDATTPADDDDATTPPPDDDDDDATTPPPDDDDDDATTPPPDDDDDDATTPSPDDDDASTPPADDDDASSPPADDDASPADDDDSGLATQPPGQSGACDCQSSVLARTSPRGLLLLPLLSAAIGSRRRPRAA
jgi:hypothetical protein